MFNWIGYKMTHNDVFLVTGAAGFIGSNFVRYMFEKYHKIKIISLDKLTYAGSLKNLSNLSDLYSHKFVQGDICDQNLILNLLRQYSITKIINFAAESHVDRSIENPLNFVQTNVLGTFQLLEAARQVWIVEKKWNQTQCRFHHISTDEVFGSLSLHDLPFSEITPYDPQSPYSATKASSDHLVKAYANTYGLPISITNCSNNYGPFQHSEKLIPTVIRSCLEQQSIPVYGDGSNIRDWLYVVDHCSAIDTVLQRDCVGECFNVGGNTEVSNMSLVKMICKIMNQLRPASTNYESLISFVADRPGHDWRYAIDNSKIKNKLGWEPTHKLDEGLLYTVQHYLAAGF